jgi:hypothetical protein
MITSFPCSFQFITLLLVLPSALLSDSDSIVKQTTEKAFLVVVLDGSSYQVLINDTELGTTMNHTKLCGEAQFTAHGQAYSGSCSSLQWLLLAGTVAFFFLWWWVEIWKYLTYICSLQRCCAYNTKWGTQYVSNFSSFTVLLNLYLSQDVCLLLRFNTEHFVICCSDYLPLLVLNKISINHS